MNKQYNPHKMTRAEIIRSLVTTLQQVSFETDGDDPIYVSDTKGTKMGVEIECTDGTVIALDVNQVN